MVLAQHPQPAALLLTPTRARPTRPAQGPSATQGVAAISRPYVFGERVTCGPAPDAFFRGTPFGWQSTQATVWTSCALSILRKVVSIASTSRLQLLSRGWQLAHEARVV